MANDRIKTIRKLQDRKVRQSSGLYYIEGLRIVAEAIEQGVEIDTLVVAPDLLKSSFGQQLVACQKEQGNNVLEVSLEVFQRISLKQGPQGLGAVVCQKWISLSEIHLEKKEGFCSGTWVALDAVADPGNLGTILRTQDAVGSPGVILLDQSTDPYDAAAVRASMGALFSQKLVKASLEEFTAWKQLTGLPIIGASGDAHEDYHTFRYPSEMVLLMGSERHGLLDQHLALCDALVRIPMFGSSDSLNLAVATSVILYEILNQRREKP